MDQPPSDQKSFRRIKAERVSIVAYEDIISYDLRGDEHYICPHFFCRFRHNGTPFIEEYYISLDEELSHFYFEQSAKIEST